MDVLVDDMKPLLKDEARFVADCLTQKNPIMVAQDLDFVPFQNIQTGNIVLPNGYEARVSRNLDKKNPQAPFTMILTKEQPEGKRVSADRELHTTDVELMKSMATGMTFNELSVKLCLAAELPLNVFSRKPHPNDLVLFNSKKHTSEQQRVMLEPEVTEPVTLMSCRKELVASRPIVGTEMCEFNPQQDALVDMQTEGPDESKLPSKLEAPAAFRSLPHLSESRIEWTPGKGQAKRPVAHLNGNGKSSFIPPKPVGVN